MRHTLLKTALIGSGAALLIAAGPKADLNQDGQVTKAEFTQAAQSKFFATDTNNDGLLTEAERKAHRQAMRENRKDKRFENSTRMATVFYHAMKWMRLAQSEKNAEMPCVPKHWKNMIQIWTAN